MSLAQQLKPNSGIIDLTIIDRLPRTHPSIF